MQNIHSAAGSGNGGRFILTEFKPTFDPGRGLGLQSLEPALTAAGFSSPALPVQRSSPLSMSLRELLGSGDAPAGELLRECQGQTDLALAAHCVQRLAARMAGAGRIVTEDERKEATAAAACALTVWRSNDPVNDEEPERLGARVAWRAVVRELSRDWLGESIPLCTVADDWLWFNRAQGDESRMERAARLKVERLAKTRHARLLRRMANLPPGRGKRKEAIERVGRAAVFLLEGERLDTAAQMAGFNPSGATRAGDRLVRSVIRLGLIGEGFAIRRAHRH